MLMALLLQVTSDRRFAPPKILARCPITTEYFVLL